MFLDELQVGKWATIDEMFDDNISLKLIEMGCLPGEKVCVRISAPFNDPIAIEVDGNLVSIRKSDAKSIKIKEAVA